LKFKQKGGEKNMKKAIIFIVAMAVMASVTGVAFARTMAEEMSSVRDYLNVVDAKLATAKNAKNEKKIRLLHAEKTATLARWYKLKASMVTPVAPAPAPAPTPAPVVNVTTPAPIVVMPSPAPGLFGMGVPVALSGLYINTGKGTYSGTGGLKGEVILNDFTGLSNMLGLAPKAINYKIGVGVADGGGGDLKAIPVYAGGTIALPMMNGMEPYLVGGLNYVVYGNGKTSGKIGGDAGLGLKVDMGFGIGKTGLELGWGVVRSNTVTSKGLMFSVSQTIVL
jgi:hypothetical protein